MIADTTEPSYWLNWRFILCVVWMLAATVSSAILIWKNEGFKKSRDEKSDNQRQTAGSVYRGEAWKTSLKTIHPAWLLAYRITALILLLASIISNFVSDGASIFFYYTQWTFVLVTIHFALGSSLSIYGCWQSGKEVGVSRIHHVDLDAERDTNVDGENANMPSMSESLSNHDEPDIRKPANILGYIFQITFQTCAGAVVLTDCVFWGSIYPFLSDVDFETEFFLVIMHLVNVVFLLGDVMLNRLRFPFFRVAYFLLWTVLYVIFQWINHVFNFIWWPYSFFEMESPYAPLWYLTVGLFHIPCYAVFYFIVRLRHRWFSRSFPESNQTMREDAADF